MGIALLFTIYAFWLRVQNLGYASFWVDEFSTASQAQQILKHGLTYFTGAFHPELNNILTHYIVALSFAIVGVSEYAARIPFVLLGSLVPVALYLLVRKNFGVAVACSAALLTSCSYFMIVWSRQARGYSLQTLLVIGTIGYYLHIRKRRPTLLHGIVLTSLVILGLLTHSAYILVLLALLADVLIGRRTMRASWGTNRSWILPAIICVLVGSVGMVFGYATVLQRAIWSELFHTNNLWYYHSFLWRQYGLITFLGFTGLAVEYSRQKDTIRPIALYILATLIFTSFVWPPYTSRYLVTIFPFLFLGMAISLLRLFRSPVVTILMTVAIVLNGNLFVMKPKQYYSINHDFREISNIDYAQVYRLIHEKGRIPEGRTAVVDTWHDRLYWYMGQDYTAAYLFRWIDGPTRINGLPQHTDFSLNETGEKIIPDRPSLRFIGELKDLKRAMKIYPKGFIFIDDSSLPKDVIDYAEKNFTKELYLDHYPLDDNPYSVWPATLYSWGIK